MGYLGLAIERDHPRSRGVYVRAASGFPRRIRIIPARAGFTILQTPRPRHCEDHPRSRGVYHHHHTHILRRGGSSPLARGLPVRPERLGVRHGIIPARAGFTPWKCGASPRSWDHPRSRGVYTMEMRRVAPELGSSPLARGLLTSPRISDHTGGIIPARAGFTPPGMAYPTRTRDHPRSRGVYTVVGHLVEGPGWIIPARAGFTSKRPPEPWPIGDHPRSRGVYPHEGRTRGGSLGSSPLARGLPEKALPWITASRIIPARAGFTTANQISHVRVKDHPRSRGVYIRRRCAPSSTSGSSPLARGLPVHPPDHKVGAGIIPARAGFTSTGPRCPCRRPDHPRSRGVYSTCATLRLSIAGSSPLARGLRRETRHVNAHRGIIPARAGFTRRPPDLGARGADHPRSRGVYTSSIGHRAISEGSSPLARGLRWWCCQPSTCVTDHPRSRGVYTQC